MRLVIVGGGLAGATAALAARINGADVAVVSRAPGATALYSGAMQMDPDLERLLNETPDHPLARLGFDAVRLSLEMDQAVAQLSTALEKAGLSLGGGRRQRGIFSDLHGMLRTAQMAPASVWAGELSTLSSRAVGVLGIAQIGDYAAESLAESLHDQLGIRAEAVTVTVDDLLPGATVADLVGRPAPRPPRMRAEVWAYPPGFADLPAGTFELLCSTPPVHGWRLHSALEGAVRGAGATWRRASVLGFEHDHDQLIGVSTSEGMIAADQVVLASGRFIAGGLSWGAGRSAPTESLLGLPTYWDGRPVCGAEASRVRRLQYLSPEPAFQLGLATDDQLRPLDERGEVAWNNLRAAGVLLGGRDYADGQGFGMPILTGWLAGRMAVA